MSEKQIQHLINAVTGLESAIRAVSDGAKLSPLHKDQFDRAIAQARSDVAKARAAVEDPTLALR